MAVHIDISPHDHTVLIRAYISPCHFALIHADRLLSLQAPAQPKPAALKWTPRSRSYDNNFVRRLNGTGRKMAARNVSCAALLVSLLSATTSANLQPTPGQSQGECRNLSVIKCHIVLLSHQVILPRVAYLH